MPRRFENRLCEKFLSSFFLFPLPSPAFSYVAIDLHILFLDDSLLRSKVGHLGPERVGLARACTVLHQSVCVQHKVGEFGEERAHPGFMADGWYVGECIACLGASKPGRDIPLSLQARVAVLFPLALVRCLPHVSSKSGWTNNESMVPVAGAATMYWLDGMDGWVDAGLQTSHRHLCFLGAHAGVPIPLPHLISPHVAICASGSAGRRE